jgi:hypothetical protein
MLSVINAIFHFNCDRASNGNINKCSDWKICVRKKGRKEKRKEGRKEERKEGRKSVNLKALFQHFLEKT